jgi:hypothetical protein
LETSLFRGKVCALSVTKNGSGNILGAFFTTHPVTLMDFFFFRVAAPVLQTAKLHAKNSKSSNTFLYVFKHVTKYGHYPEVMARNTSLTYFRGMGHFHFV